MKKTRRFAAIAAAAMMTAALAVPMMSMNAFAASGTNSITINADSKDMTHGDMKAYQVFAGTYNVTSAPGAQKPTGNLTVTNWGDGINAAKFVEALKGDVTFNVTVTNEDGTETTKNVFADIPEVTVENGATTATAVADIVGTWSSGGARARAFAKLAVANKATNSGTYSVADGENKAKIEGLADGYYVIEDANAAVANPETDGSAFTLGLLQVAGNIPTEVTPKLDYPTVIKKVQEDDQTDNTAGYGEGYNDVADWDVNTPVPFKIIATVPSNIDVYEHYYMEFTDTLDNNFGVPENIAVSIGDTKLEANTHYMVEAGTDANDMKIVIKDLKNCGVTVTSGARVTVTYTAKLNVAADESTGAVTAVVGRPGQENKVKLEYSNNPNNTGDGTKKPKHTGKTPEDKVIVFTYELDVTKVDGVTGEALKDAEFVLYKETNATTHAKVWAKVDANGYFAEWTDNESQATKLKSGVDGTFKIIGLDDGTYVLSEKTAPQGYNLPGDGFTVVIDANTMFTQDDYEKMATEGNKIPLIDLSATIAEQRANVDESKGIVSGTIENNKGSVLPSTGGIGTTLFYVVGGVLVVGAGVTLITKKRIGKDAE